MRDRHLMRLKCFEDDMQYVDENYGFNVMKQNALNTFEYPKRYLI